MLMKPARTFDRVEGVTCLMVIDGDTAALTPPKITATKVTSSAMPHVPCKAFRAMARIWLAYTAASFIRQLFRKEPCPPGRSQYLMRRRRFLDPIEPVSNPAIQPETAGPYAKILSIEAYFTENSPER